MNYLRPVYLKVNLSQLQRNIEAIREHVSGVMVMPMVKANAYGHGLDGVAQFIEPYVDYFGVAILDEGIHLRKLGIKKPILVAGGTLLEELFYFAEYDLTLTGSSPELLTAAEDVAHRSGTKIKVHLKFDTGMERVGFHEYEAQELIEKSEACSHLTIEGIYTHLANSEVTDKKHSIEQLKRFEEVLSSFSKSNVSIPQIKHVCNSGGILNLPEAYFDMVRPGILFYGVYPGPGIDHFLDVRPALSWRAKVSFSKRTRPGRPVSYGSLWQAEAETRIVTIPCGYADGYFRRMTNQAQVLINGKRYPQVGRICMDQFMVNVGEDEINTGDEVVLLGDGIHANELAEWTGTNAYEVLTNISTRVPRVFVIE